MTPAAGDTGPAGSGSGVTLAWEAFGEESPALGFFTELLAKAPGDFPGVAAVPLED